MQLLTTGKSLVGQKDSEARYRMGRPGMLPNFGSKKNPFLKKASGANRAEESRAEQSDFKAGQAQGSLDPLMVVCGGQPAAQVEKLARPSALVNEPTVEKPARVAARPRLEPSARNSSGSGVVAKIKGIANAIWWKRAPRTPRKAAPVQAELSLDQIKVVRNDLSDVDIDLVARRQSKSAASKDKAKTSVIPGVAPRAVENEIGMELEMADRA
jgi:hypothetical protein